MKAGLTRFYGATSLAVHIRSGFEGLPIGVPPEHWPGPVEGGMASLIERLLQLAHRIDSKRVAASKRGPKRNVPKGDVDAETGPIRPTTRAFSSAALRASMSDGNAMPPGHQVHRMPHSRNRPKNPRLHPSHRLVMRAAPRPSFTGGDDRSTQRDHANPRVSRRESR